MTNPAIRLEFKKFGGLKYISHLDLQRALLRFIKRANIPIRYTEGFNPHPKIVFALTMSVGMESECELVDIYLARDPSDPETPVMTPDEFIRLLSEILPNGLEIVSASFPEKSFSDIVTADYTVTLDKKNDEELSSFVVETFSDKVEILKKTKSGEKLIDITPLIEELSATDEGNACIIKARLSARQGEYLNPEMLVKGLLLTPRGEKSIDSWQVKRVSINFKEN